MSGYFSPDASRKASQNVSRTASRPWAVSRILRFGPPLVSISALIWAAPALAQTTISNSTSKPLLTSQTGDLTINTNIAVKPPSGVAVTIDSNNTVTNNGVIEFQNLSNVTGILANGGLTSSITINGTVEVDDTSTPATDSHGIQHGPFATGTNMYGVRIIGPGDFGGGFLNESTATITVKGNNSAAVSIETNLDGALNNGGAINITGNNTFGIHTTGTVGSDVTLGGTITAVGQGTQAVNLGGDIAGALLINGTITSTGYRYTTRSTDPNFLKELQADDLLQSSATITVAGSVAGGILVDQAVTDPTTGDVTGLTGTVSSIAAAPALVVGAVGRNITLGNVGTDVDAFGIEIKGSVLGSGIYDGVTSAGLQVGVVGGGQVDTGGGVHISGTIGANSFAADATAVHLYGGVLAPVFRNDGSISGTLSSDALGATARGILIEAGANVPVLQNSNTINATVAGQLADAAAVVDRSGTLVEIENIGIISTTRTLTDPTQPVSGGNIAIDVSANTTGVHLIQDLPAGAILEPTITGSVLFGSGNDRVEILAGTLTGDVDLGAGANTLTIDNGAIVKGALNATGGTIALTVGTGTLQINNASQLNLTSLSLGGASALILTADPSLGLATKFTVDGSATIGTGATIGMRLAAIQQGTATYTLIQANQLTSGTIDSALLGTTPYLYNTSIQTNTQAGTVSATLTLKTAAQLDLPATTAGAYQQVINNIGLDTGLTGALLAQTERTGLITLYNQLLPNHSGSIFNMVSASIDAMGRPLDERQDPEGGGFWMQETNTGVFSNGTSDDPGYKGWSLGAIAGYEMPRTPLGILGATFGVSSNQIYPDATDAAENLHATLVDVGVYWRFTKGGFTADARIAGDYARVASDRVIEVLGGDGLGVGRTASANWSSFGFNARAMAAYEAHFGNVYVRPQASVDYLRFVEGAYTESGGGDGMDLSVDSRTSSRATAFAGVAVGALYGPDHSWGPEALLGYKGVASEVLGVTTARFVAGGDPFALQSENIPGQGISAHFSLKGENGSGGFAVTTGAEVRDGLNIYDLRLTGHLQF